MCQFERKSSTALVKYLPSNLGLPIDSIVRPSCIVYVLCSMYKFIWRNSQCYTNQSSFQRERPRENKVVLRSELMQGGLHGAQNDES